MFEIENKNTPKIVGGGGTKTYFKNDLQKKGGCYRKRVVSSLRIERKEVNAL